VIFLGAGKTRVLVPMLILEYTSLEAICRVNVLPSIANEAMAYFRTVLVASFLHVQLFSMPFHRDIPLDDSLAGRLTDTMRRCKENRGCFVVTAQQRNSLLLKQYDQGTFVEGLNEAFVDILDESDAILHHDFQLVYALGAQVDLPAGSCRWMVLQALLKTLSRSKNEEILMILNDTSLVHNEPSACGSFPKMRMLLPFKSHARSLGTSLLRELLADPSYEFRWMEDVQSNEIELLVTIMSDPSHTDAEANIEANALFKKNESYILAARGFIAFGLLFHGLEARYRVNYGLNPKLSTAMAVCRLRNLLPDKSA
jgi:hypothetical protein